jgi:hypothetical protein
MTSSSIGARLRALEAPARAEQPFSPALFLDQVNERATATGENPCDLAQRMLAGLADHELTELCKFYGKEVHLR